MNERESTGGGAVRGARARLFPLLPVLVLLGASACDEPEPPNLNPPDSLLQAELGLTDADRVHRVTLGSSPSGVESVDPTEVRLEPGHFVEFFSADGRVRMVYFVLDSLAAPQAEFLRSTAQDRSPPMVERETRFLVSFRDAPQGRYPFLVEGNERAIRGVLVVESAASRP